MIICMCALGDVGTSAPLGQLGLPGEVDPPGGPTTGLVMLAFSPHSRRGYVPVPIGQVPGGGTTRPLHYAPEPCTAPDNIH